MSGPKQMTIAVLAERLDATNERLDKVEGSIDALTAAVNHRNTENEARLTKVEQFNAWILRISGSVVALGMLAAVLYNALK